jgi:hypothetical protein
MGSDRVDGAAMDVGAVDRVRTAEQVGMRRAPNDVAPALGVEGAGRMGEDSYGQAKQQDRGMEEETDVVEESEEGSESTSGRRDGSGVNLFA